MLKIRKKIFKFLVKGLLKDYKVLHELQKKKIIQLISPKITKKKNCLSLHYNGANSYLFVYGTKIHKLKANDSEIVATQLCLGNISKDVSVDNMKKSGLNGYVHDLSVDYDATFNGKE